MLKIYADPITINCRKVLAGLQLMKVPYELDLVSFFAGEHTQDQYLSINPNATLPTAVDNELTLWESNAILQYVADKNGESNFYPPDAEQRANINRWMFWEATNWFASCYVYMLENCAKPLVGADPDVALLEAESERFQKLAGILDSQLERTTWLCGESVTLADISVAAPIHMHEYAGIPLADFPNLHQWMTQRIESLPCWQNTHVGEGFTLGDPL